MMFYITVVLVCFYLKTQCHYFINLMRGRGREVEGEEQRVGGAERGRGGEEKGEEKGGEPEII